jgi:dUTP pyrophosphatase
MQQAGQPAGDAIAIRMKRLENGAGLPDPAYHSLLAAGFDLAAAIPADETLTLAPGARALVPTGFAIEVPQGFQGEVRPRSGLALRHGVTVLNSPGTIDADYRGEIMVLLINHGQEPVQIRRGLRIAQLLITPVARVSLEIIAQLSESARGDGGFGSTG